jgi:hypothetical protein
LLKQLHKFLFVDDLLASPSGAAPLTSEPLRKKLQKDLARLTLFAYVLLVFNPVMPLIADKMAHTFWLEYHLVTVHHVYGDGHLHLEMVNNAKHAGTEKTSGNTKSSTNEYVHVVPDAGYQFFYACLTDSPYPVYNINLSVIHPPIDYQPPEV